jgi:hypothetical protein
MIQVKAIGIKIDRHVSAMMRYEQPLLVSLLIPYIGQCLQGVYFVIKVTLQLCIQCKQSPIYRVSSAANSDCAHLIAVGQDM